MSVELFSTLRDCRGARVGCRDGAWPRWPVRYAGTARFSMFVAGAGVSDNAEATVAFAWIVWGSMGARFLRACDWRVGVILSGGATSLARELVERVTTGGPWQVFLSARSGLENELG